MGISLKLTTNWGTKSLQKFTKSEIMSCILSDYNSAKLKIKNKRSPSSYNSVILNSILLNDEPVKAN